MTESKGDESRQLVLGGGGEGREAVKRLGLGGASGRTSIVETKHIIRSEDSASIESERMPASVDDSNGGMSGVPVLAQGIATTVKESIVRGDIGFANSTQFMIEALIQLDDKATACGGEQEETGVGIECDRTNIIGVFR